MKNIIIKKNHLYKSMSLIFGGSLLYYINNLNQKKDIIISQNYRSLFYLRIFYELEGFFLRKKIIQCRKDQKNELDTISMEDLNKSENFLKKIEEKLDFILAKKNHNNVMKELVKFDNNLILKKLINEKNIMDCLKLEKFAKLNDNQIKNKNYFIKKLSKIIQPGIDNPQANIPIVIRDKDDYRCFKKILIDFIKLYHGVDVVTNKAEKETFNLIKSFLFILDQDIITNKFIEVDITTHRNINDFDFPASISSRKRNELLNYIKNTLEEIEPKVFQRIKNPKINSEEEENYFEKDDFIKGRFSKISRDPILSDKLINKNPVLKSAGVFRDWPEDRMIYFNLEDDLLCFINEEDHLKIRLNTKDPNKITDNLIIYFDLLEKLESKFPFAYDNEIGYLTSLPVNTGASTIFKIKIKIPKKENVQGRLKNALEESWNDLVINLEENNEEGYILSLSNKSPYYSFANLLIDIIKIKDLIK